MDTFSGCLSRPAGPLPEVVNGRSAAASSPIYPASAGSPGLTDHLLGRETLRTLDLAGLTPQQIAHLQLLVEDLRGG